MLLQAYWLLAMQIRLSCTVIHAGCLHRANHSCIDADSTVGTLRDPGIRLQVEKVTREVKTPHF